jgi:hypothetical protein
MKTQYDWKFFIDRPDFGRKTHLVLYGIDRSDDSKEVSVKVDNGKLTLFTLPADEDVIPFLDLGDIANSESILHAMAEELYGRGYLKSKSDFVKLTMSYYIWRKKLWRFLQHIFRRNK